MKIIKVTLIFVLAALFLTSCLNYTQTTTLKIDGSGKMFIHYWTKLKNADDTSTVNELGIFNKEKISKEFTAPFTTIKEIDIYNDVKDTTIHAKVEFEFSKLDSLNKIKVFKDDKFSLKDGPENTKIFSQFIPPFATDLGIDRKKFAIIYEYYIPGDVLFHNADELSNNKLTWRFTLDDLGPGKNITATFRPFKLKETPTWVLLLACSVLCVVFVFLFKKKKK